MDLPVLIGASLGNAALAACCGYALGRARLPAVRTAASPSSPSPLRAIESLDADSADLVEEIDAFLGDARPGDGRAESSPLARAVRRYARRLSDAGKQLAESGTDRATAAGTQAGTEHLIRRRLEKDIDRCRGRVSAFLATVEAELGRPPGATDVAAVLLEAADEFSSDIRRLRDELGRAKRSLTELQTELKDARHEARIDPLTRLANRRAFEERLLAFQAALDRAGEPFAVAVFDLDRFKILNDTYGHPAGDATLQVFGRVLEEAVRPYDSAARTGGEEFAVLLAGADEAAATEAADRIRRKAAQASVRSGGRVIRFTVSGGYAVASRGVPAAETLAAADDALYSAKADGRDRVAAAQLV